MSQKIKFELDKAGVKALLKSEQMVNCCEEYADKALNNLGEGYSKSKHMGRNRVNVSVKADTQKARADNLKNNTILKAVGG